MPRTTYLRLAFGSLICAATISGCDSNRRAHPSPDHARAASDDESASDADAATSPAPDADLAQAHPDISRSDPGHELDAAGSDGPDAAGTRDASNTSNAAGNTRDSSTASDAGEPLAPAWQPIELGACGDGPLSFEGRSPQPSMPDWSEGAKVPITGWANRYGYVGQTLITHVRNGRERTISYPVTVSASWLPKRLVDTAIDLKDFGTELNPLSAYKNLTEFESWLGLHPFPDCDGQGARSLPFPGGQRPDYLVGSSRHAFPEGEGLSYGCASCHSAQLFGRTILGLQNRASRANIGIAAANQALGNANVLTDIVLSLLLDASDGELAMLNRMQRGLHRVGTHAPLLRGLDTSLAQVALSLAKRAKDPYATPDETLENKPRTDWLDDHPADSKPGNWWVLKYKNRWLLDGSVVSGNPVYTNLLWNEIGRGTDLRELESWADANLDTINDMTAAVFATEPVRFTEFFPADSIDLESAKRGKALFDGSCASCHGSYEKGWEQSNAAALPLDAKLATVQVRYHETTPVIDVGTDGHRAKGAESLLQLNDLAISRKFGVVMKAQTGYVPPPLDGIWARFPYFHNNSAPSLCAVLTRASERPATYHGGEANDKQRDFDQTCNGYPTGDKVPAAWKADPEALYDTSVPGLGNQGHDEGVFLDAGVERFTPGEKHDIIVFLQTL